MPKSNKHKKARAADFAKAKLKLGKGKQIAANATNTSFASRSIGLPTQSLAITKDAPTSRRNLTLPDLLIQCRHYSPSVKKEALTELLALLAAYPFLLLQHLLPLISHLSHLISDAAPTIRKQSIELLRYIFDELPVESLEGSSQGLILFTVASLSSLDEGIRIDALKVLDLLLERIPAEIVRGWDGGMEVQEERKGSLEDKGVGGKVVEALLGVLRVRSAGLAVGQGGYTSAASADLSPSSRLAILTTLASFLRTALSPIASTSTAPPPWYLSNSFSTLRSYDSFVRSFTSSPPSSRHATFPSADGSLESSSLAFALPTDEFSLDFLELPSPPKAVLPTATAPPTLLSLLHPTLLSSFLDSAPTAFAPTLESMEIDAHLTTVAAVIAVARELYWSELGGVEVEGMERERESARTMLVAMLGHVGIYFPFGGDALGERTAEADAQLLSLNLTFASLVSLLVLSAPSTSAARRPKGKQTKTKARKEGETNARIELMVQYVSEWVVSALRGEITTTTSPLGIALTPDAYSALEPTIWALLNQPPTPTADGPQASEQVFDGVLDHFAKTSALSESKKRAFEFIARAVLIQEDSAHTNRFELEAGIPGTKISPWLLSLPKYLWELGSKHLATTDLVLTFLRRMASQGEKGSFSAEVLASLQAPLVPFFHLQHPTRGAMPGPFLRLPVDLQRKAVDLVWYILREDEGGKRLGASVGAAAKGVGEEMVQRWERQVRN